ncbi:MAG TPA: type II toxin-antitoxin system VapC family toxin [Polyangiaceae bacterium]|nr:type II toxin-antitoxin system VapC family toxin [Polyangiaceae bacterium]
MPSAEKVYVDPSALRSLYVHDDRAKRFCAWRRRLGGSLPVTRFGRAEVVNSIQLAVHRELIDGDTAQEALADLEDDLSTGRLTLVDALWRRTLDLAADLSLRYTGKLGTRTLDVLHVATAVVLGSTHFASYDHRQSALAKALGLKALAP